MTAASAPALDMAIVERPQAQRSSAEFPNQPPWLARALHNRGLRSAAELQLSTAGLLPPDDLLGMDAAVARLGHAVVAGERILLVGDFDADGATAVALGVSLLQAMGANVGFEVPNRFDFGYGLTPEIVALALRRDDPAPQLIVTADNGISSHAGVACAREAGIDVLVTDHHLPGDDLPDACAIVNPNQPGCGFASKHLAGVGVLWYLLSALRRHLRERHWFQSRPEPNPAAWLDLVALGTVADVVPLDRNNRILVQQGLLRMRAERTRPGVRALAAVAGRTLARLDAADLGFALGPRLNAAGRLEDMTIGIRCLLAGDDQEARSLATALNELNRSRRSIEAQMSQEAELALLDVVEEGRERLGLCVYREHWHQGVVGIVAGRMRERFHRPVIAFAEAGSTAPDELKGSARSIPGLHVRDVLAAIDAVHPGLIVRFGGHAMAAGLSLKRRHYERFGRAFDTAVAERLSPEIAQARIDSDGDLAAADLTLANADAVAALGPWGQAFPEPLFHGEFELVSQRVVGEVHLKLVLRRDDSVFDAIAFRQQPLAAGTRRVLLAYRLSANEYRERRSLQLRVEHLRAIN